MNLEEIKQVAEKCKGIPSATWSNARMLEVLAEIERLQKSRPKICDICFTSSWQPCPPLTAGSVQDGNGGWMVCGHCQLVQAFEEQTQTIDRLQNELIGSQEEAAYYHSKWEEKLEG